MPESSVRRAARVVLFGSVLVALAACGGAERDEAAEFALTPVARIGQVDGAPEYAFGNIAAVLPTTDGGFYACDYNDHAIRRYDAAGQFVRAVGRKGAGPGEYGYCIDLALSGDSTLVVSDPMNGRFVFFRDDGTFDRVLGVSVAPGLGGDNAFLVDADGRIWKRGMQAEAPREAPLERGEGEFGRTQFVILDPASGSRVDSLLVPGGGGSSGGRGFALSTSEGMYVHVPPDSVWTVTPVGTFAVAGTDAYRIELRSRDGSVQQITRAVEALPYAPDERAEWEAWRAFFEKQSPQYPPVAVPERKPVIRGVRVDDRGRLWVKVHVAAEKRPIPPRPKGDPRPLLTWRERNTYDLFDSSSGDFLGRVAFPYATELMAVRSDRVWLREEGGVGEQLIGVYTLRPATGSN